ncbi:hypothetical protein V9T40_007694 [Parthenolecanium corni]|uniref:Latrophilin Cirl n=1 Tax=Parthenolecanium corni TaxID=536013 RepID=A0AAN9TLS7_9HEMI
MRELRKDVDSGLESTKEELDNMDEMKIEDVLMGLKGLKQEEVFSFLGKNNFTPAETEMSSTGFSGYDHLPTVDSVEIEQLQLSLSAHLDGIQGSIGHVFASKTDPKSKMKNEQKSAINIFECTPKPQPVVSEWLTEDSQYQRVSSSWPNEEEIIATNIGEELICTSNPEEDDFQCLPNNTYMIQSSTDRVELPDQPIYPSLDMSDDEEDVYSFDQRDDETWTPKIKIKINEVKPQRPTRNRKQNSAVAKYLKAAARKRADPAPIILESSSSSLLPPCYPPISSECVVESSPSTFSSFSSPSTSESLSSPQVPARRGRKAKPKPSPKGHKLHLRTDFKGSRLIPPKTCKLLQTSRSAVVAALQPGAPAKQQRVKADGNHTPSTSSPSNAEKKVPSSHITKLLVLLYLKMAASKDHAEYYTVYACDGKMLKIECKENYVINLIRANYGRYSITVCNDNGSTDWSVNCMSHRSFTILQGRCNQKRNCSVSASTSLFDDPCPGTVKYLEAHYACTLASASSPATRSTPPWLMTSPPSVWMTPKSFTLHSETSTVASSATTSATTLSSTKAEPKNNEPEEIDWILPNTPSLPVESSSEIEVAVPRVTSDEMSSSTEMTVLPNYDEKIPMCKPTIARNLSWNWTSGGDVSVQPCPGGATGLARWRCQIIPENQAIRYPDTPDLSECKSMWLNSLESRINEKDPLLKIATDLCQVTENKMLFGGDMLTTVKIIHEIAQKMQSDIQTFSDYHQREEMVSELLQSAVQVGSNLLDASQQASWKDLSYKEQVRVASSLLIGLEENSFLLAETMTRERVVTHCMKNILLSVQILEVKNVVNEHFPTYTVTEKCSLKVNNWLQLDKSSLLENSDSGLVRLVYTAFDTLETVLKAQPNNPEEKKINSKVLSASLGKGRHIQLAQPVELCLEHLQTENVSNPTCVFWDYSEKEWSEEGCFLVATNKTHTICRCAHLTNFAILVDIRPTTFSDGSMSVTSLILLFVALLILMVVGGFLFARYLRKQHTRKEYGSATFASDDGDWLRKCYGCCRTSAESEKTLNYKEPRPALYGNATMQSMASVADNDGVAIYATQVIAHASNTIPRSYMAENSIESHYQTSHLKLNHNYPTYNRNGSIRKIREARRLEHLENTLQQRNKKLASGSLRSNSPRSHTYSEIASASHRSDPVYEEIEREREHCGQISDISDEDAKRNSDMSRQSSKSYGDHRPLIPYNAVTDQNFHAVLDAAYRQQLKEHSARTVSVLDGQTVVCHLQQSDPRIYHKSVSHALPPHHF